MRRGSSLWVLGALSTRGLGVVVPKPYEVNSTSVIAISPPYASGSGLPVQLPSPSSPDSHSTWTSLSTPTSPNSSFYVVPSSLSKASPASSKLPTLEYPSGSSSGNPPYVSSSSLTASDYASVVVVVVSETEVYQPTPGSFVTSTPVLTSDCPSGSVTSQAVIALPASSTLTIASSALQSGKSVKADNISAVPAALPTGSTIDLELLSSIFFSNIIQRSIKTRTTTTTTTIILTLPTPLPAPSSTIFSSAITSPTTVTSLVLPPSSRLTPTASPAPTSTNIPAPSESTSQTPPSLSTILSTVTITSSVSSGTFATGFPTSPPFSYNPSASRGSATPITRPTPEPSSAEAAGSTLSTFSTASSAGNSQNTGIPPAPSAAGASGGMIGRGKERVWWVAFFVPVMFMA
ncbi:hypothetical protein DDE82_004545 [Stemphylium lycopersici]|uniref:Uncharacterized protein n=1 Tax=Stemphylium lycopersici TaxID=183478 RepID=A0A364MXR6_STELY|nr:hypothetical protein DDE82_004545 [Stemphylium lycopersici]RAR06752.1 hypothetical protein DDE83_006811 [Stemphylium lycopersici]